MRRGIMILLLLSTALAAAVTVTLRTGQKVVGNVVSMDETNVVLQTAAGRKTYPWRMLSNDSIKRLNPALYNRLLQRAQERLQRQTQSVQAVTVRARERAAEAVQPAAVADLSNIYLRIDTDTCEGGQAKVSGRELRRSGIMSWDRKEITSRYGEVTVALENLNPKRIYTVRAKMALYLDAVYGGKNLGANVRYDVRTVTGAGEQAVTNASSAKLKFQTEKYEEVRWYGAAYAVEKYNVRYWDISIWINDELVYEAKGKKSPIVRHVRKK